MALNKSMSNIVIGFDDRKGFAEVFVNKGNDFRKATIEQFSIDKSLIKSESKVYDTLNLVLSAFLGDKDLGQPDVYVVLPDHYITIDLVTLPMLKMNKMKDVLKAELKKLYVNFDELEFNSSIYSKSKKQIVFSCTLVKKNILSQIVSVMKRHNLNLRNVSYESNACVNSFIALGNKSKHSSYIFASIGEDSSSLISVNKDKLINFMPLNIGTNIISGEKRVYESDVNDNYASEFLQFNVAKSSGESRKVELDYKDDFITSFESVRKNIHKKQNEMDDYAYMFSKENSKANLDPKNGGKHDKQLKNTQDKISVNANGQNKDSVANQSSTQKTSIQIGATPATDVPNSVEQAVQGDYCVVKDAEILKQNFAVFKRYISAYKYDQKQRLNDVKELAIINLPSGYKKAVTNGSFDDLKYLYIDDALIDNCFITDFFKLYGMIYAVVYNKGQNFMDKEKQSIFGRITMNTSFAFRAVNRFFSQLAKKGKSKR